MYDFLQNLKNVTFYVFLPCFICFLELWYTCVIQYYDLRINLQQDHWNCSWGR